MDGTFLFVCFMSWLPIYKQIAIFIIYCLQLKLECIENLAENFLHCTLEKKIMKDGASLQLFRETWYFLLSKYTLTCFKVIISKRSIYHMTFLNRKCTKESVSKFVYDLIQLRAFESSSQSKYFGFKNLVNHQDFCIWGLVK